MVSVEVSVLAGVFYSGLVKIERKGPWRVTSQASLSPVHWEHQCLNLLPVRKNKFLSRR